jgi:predicted nucleic acid-binding protein
VAPSASTPALICDTGAILDYLVRGAPDHQRFRKAIDSARARFVPGLVLAEVDYFLRGNRQAMSAFVGDIRRGAFTYAPPSGDHLWRAMQVDARFADLSLGLVDASIVVLAEELGMKRVATRDIRHFGAVRLSNGDALELVVQPTRPDRG